MTEEKVASLIREFVTALTKGDVDKAISFVAEDATWITPEGTFQGKEEIRRYMNWTNDFVKDMTYTETGIGLMVQGDQAAYEHSFEGTIEGERVNWLAMCGYNISGELIQHMRTTQDRLGVLQQAAQGWLEETMINAIVKRAEKGLH
jgi:hypothetical protein